MNGELLMVVGGGTGGHIYPGVAVAEAWTARGGRVVYVGSATGMEARVVPALGYDFVPVEARRLKNAGAVERLKSLSRMPGAICQGRALLKKWAPNVVLGVGGYVSGPVVLAAALTRRACAVAEQNARPGLTNRILARFVRRVYSAFPEVAERLGQRKVRMLGNPVRRAFIDAVARPAPKRSGRAVLVLGGSQGSKALNDRLPVALSALREAFPGLQVRHQAGQGKAEPVRAAYAAAGFTDAVVDEFIDDVPSALLAADLVVARAGATTVAELACVGRPALFVPFPHAADDHQAANAQSLVDAEAAVMEREETLDDARLRSQLTALLGDPARLAAMEGKARALGRPEAADAIVDDLMALAGGAK